MILFRTDNMNDLAPIQRSTLNVSNIPSTEVDNLIAHEIRKEINGSKHRNIYSYSLSLGCVLFKYNFLADNPLLIYQNNEVEGFLHFSIKYPTGKVEVLDHSFNIGDAEFFFSKLYPNCEISIIDFQILVNDNILLDDYLMRHTNTHRKKLASSEKDSEVVLFQEPDALIIDEHSIDAVFFLYALQWRFSFLDNPDMNQALKDAISYRSKIEGRFTEDECTAFHFLIDYLTFCIAREKDLSMPFIIQQNLIERTTWWSDGYKLALEIIFNYQEDTLADILQDCFCHDIWYIFNYGPKKFYEYINNK